MPIVFLAVEDVEKLHHDQIVRYGGDPGVLNREAIESAVAAPQQGIAGDYIHSFPWGMAAAYAYYLTANHGFVDGNKRTGFAAAFVFLRANGWDLPPGAGPGLRDLLLATANGERNREAIGQHLEHWAERI